MRLYSKTWQKQYTRELLHNEKDIRTAKNVGYDVATIKVLRHSWNKTLTRDMVLRLIDESICLLKRYGSPEDQAAISKNIDRKEPDLTKLMMEAMHLSNRVCHIVDDVYNKVVVFDRVSREKDLIRKVMLEEAKTYKDIEDCHG